MQTLEKEGHQGCPLRFNLSMMKMGWLPSDQTHRMTTILVPFPFKEKAGIPCHPRDSPNSLEEAGLPSINTLQTTSGGGSPPFKHRQ